MLLLLFLLLLLPPSLCDLQEPNSNLGAEEDDFLEFEPFPDVEVEAGPRTLPSGGTVIFFFLNSKLFSSCPKAFWVFFFSSSLVTALQVEHVDMNWKTNAQVHHTYMYNTNLLVVRRGTEFLVTVTFNQPLTQQDTFKLEFLIGELQTKPFLTDSALNLLFLYFGLKPTWLVSA